MTYYMSAHVHTDTHKHGYANVHMHRPVLIHTDTLRHSTDVHTNPKCQKSKPNAQATLCTASHSPICILEVDVHPLGRSQQLWKRQRRRRP